MATDFSAELDQLRHTFDSISAVTDPEASESVKNRMSCRALLLDQEALDNLRQSDPNAYRSTFGDNNSPYFCAGTPKASGGN